MYKQFSFRSTVYLESLFSIQGEPAIIQFYCTFAEVWLKDAWCRTDDTILPPFTTELIIPTSTIIEKTSVKLRTEILVLRVENPIFSTIRIWMGHESIPPYNVEVAWFGTGHAILLPLYEWTELPLSLSLRKFKPHTEYFFPRWKSDFPLPEHVWTMRAFHRYNVEVVWFGTGYAILPPFTNRKNFHFY